MHFLNSAAVGCLRVALVCICLFSATPSRAQGIRLPANLGPTFSSDATAPAKPGDRKPLKPFMAFAWQPTAPLRHVSAMLPIGPQSNPLETALASKKMPAGCRVLLSGSMANGLLDQPEDHCRDAAGNLTAFPGIWPEKGVLVVAARCDAFFSAFAGAGGECDALSLDFEDGFSNWGMRPDRLRAIAADPRFADTMTKLGLTSLHDADDLLKQVDDWRHSNGMYLKWNSRTDGIVNAALSRAVGAPLGRRLPGAGFCNYNAVIVTPPNAVPDLNGHNSYSEGPPCGSYQCPPVYGDVGNISVVGIAGDWKSPFTCVIWCADRVRACVRSSLIPVLPWISFRGRTGDDPAYPTVRWANTDYWQESVYHTLLSAGANNVLYFDPRGHRDIFTKPPPGSVSPEDDQALEDVLADIEQRAHAHPFAKALNTELMAYTDKVLASAAVTDDGHTVARVTFAPGVEAADVKIGSSTIHAVCPAGKVGVWVDVP